MLGDIVSTTATIKTVSPIDQLVELSFLEYE
jgi:hypothetical protein